MSGSTSSSDVEDVLSSIRRLVSEDLQDTPPAEARETHAPGGDTPGHPPRLVLTAALRVDAPEPEQDAAPAESPPAPRVLDRLRGSAANVSELSAVRPAPPLTRKTAEPAGEPGATPRPLFLHRSRASEAESEAQAVPHAGTTEDRPGDATEQPQPPEQGAGEQEAASEDRMTLGPGPEADEDAARDVAETIPDLDEDLIAALSDPVEEIDLGDNDESDPAEAVASDASLFADDDAQVIDEETLRVMVAEMVREELMGELGGRITRNVRKLVRREIQRALLSQDFE